MVRASVVLRGSSNIKWTSVRCTVLCRSYFKYPIFKNKVWSDCSRCWVFGCQRSLFWKWAIQHSNTGTIANSSGNKKEISNDNKKAPCKLDRINQPRRENVITVAKPSAFIQLNKSSGVVVLRSPLNCDVKTCYGKLIEKNKCT